jgi:23S rRNA-/tRNA-specific pseudouridylate synthase
MSRSGVDEKASLEAQEIAWPRPCSPPSKPGEAAREEESRRAVRAQARGAALTVADVPTLFRDDALGILVVNKPAGVYVDDVRRVVVRGVSEETPAPTRKVTMLHRLDRDTSGCLAFATCSDSNRLFSRAFRDGAAKKTYVCEISRRDAEGEDDDDGSASLSSDLPRTVRTGHGRSAHGLWRVYPESAVGESLPSGKNATGNKVKLAITRVLRALTVGSSSRGTHGMRRRYAFVGLETGRTHQIRLHMAHLGWPVAGDVKYGGGNAEGSIEGFRLHAARLVLPDEKRGETAGRVEIVAPKPDWFEEWGGGAYVRSLMETPGGSLED